jgi:hypothetical protein
MRTPYHRPTVVKVGTIAQLTQGLLPLPDFSGFLPLR